MPEVYRIITLGLKFHRQNLTISGRISLIYLKEQNMTGIKTVGYKIVIPTRGGSRPVYKICTNLSEFSQKFLLDCIL